MIGRLLGSRRAKLVGVLVVATLAITGLAVSAAGDSMSYYATPEEFAKLVRERRATMVDNLVSGLAVTNIEQYRELVGKISGLDEALEMISEAEINVNKK